MTTQTHDDAVKMHHRIQDHIDVQPYSMQPSITWYVYSEVDFFTMQGAEKIQVKEEQNIVTRLHMMTRIITIVAMLWMLKRMSQCGLRKNKKRMKKEKEKEERYTSGWI